MHLMLKEENKMLLKSSISFPFEFHLFICFNLLCSFGSMSSCGVQGKTQEFIFHSSAFLKMDMLMSKIWVFLPWPGV